MTLFVSRCTARCKRVFVYHYIGRFNAPPGFPLLFGAVSVLMMQPTLFLIDDSPDMGVVIRLLSKRAGVDVVHRCTIADGWAALHERRPDLVLLDMRVPARREGAELCCQIRAEPAFADLRVALFVNASLHDDICAGLEAGADLVFAKDLIVDADAWRQRLAEILAWTRGRVWEKLVAWKAERAWPTPPPDWLAVTNRALRQALARHLSAEVLRVVLKRAIRATFAHDLRHEETRTWLHATEAVLNEERVAAATSPESVTFLGASLAEQMWCLLGSRDSAFFTAALTPVIPGLTEALLI
jgi:CheY-like chemotaxis protein